MTLSDVSVLCDESGDSVYNMTVSMYDEKHSFDITIDNGTALVDYQESITYRGDTRVSEPPDEVWGELLASEEFMNAIPDGVENVKRV